MSTPVMDTLPEASLNSRAQAWQRLGKALPWLVLAASLLVTLQLWTGARRDAEQNLKVVFDSRVREIMGDLEQRMKTYEQVLRGVQGVFAASGGVGRDEFRTYVGTLHLEENHPGIQGVGYALIVPAAQKDRHISAIRREGFPEYAITPAGKRDIYTSVIYLEPFNERNRRAFGFDMYSDLEQPRDGDLAPGMRRAAMERARDSGKAAISGKIRLLMETDQNIQAGFLMYLPVYKVGMPHDTIAKRRANIMGWVYAPFRADDLMFGLLVEHVADFDFEIYDGGEMSDKTRMHDSDHDPGSRHGALFQSINRVKIAGRDWMVAIRSHANFEARLDNYKPAFVFGAGMAASLLLTLLTWLLVQGRERALQAARKMNKELIASEARLHAMLDNLPYLTWLKDSDGRFIAVNQTFLKTTGLQRIQEVLGKTDLDLWPRELAEKYRADDAEVMASRRQKSSTERSVMEGGKMAWVETFKAPIIDENGKLLGTTGVAQDITERIKSQQAIERITLLYKMLSEMNSANIHIRERGQLFGTACRIAMESGLFRMVWIGLLEPESGAVTPVAQAGHVEGYLDNLAINIHDAAQGNGPTGRAIRDGVPVICDDIASDPRMQPWREQALQRGYRASAVFPLTQSGQVIGALCLYCHDAGMLSEDITQVLSGLAEDISFTLDFIAESQQREKAQDELRDLSIFLQSALENERARIARELHDELGQSMTALRFDLRWLGENISEQANPVLEKLLAMNDLVGQTVDSIRRISEDLRPGMLDDLGLAAAIENHVTKFSEQSGIACDLAMNQADFDLDGQVATALFRIVQESLTNVARHSGADHVFIRLQELEDKMLLIVQDNGHGLPSQNAGKKTYGLLGMRERVKMLGGTLDVFNEKDAGVRIEACVPKHLKGRP